MHQVMDFIYALCRVFCIVWLDNFNMCRVLGTFCGCVALLTLCVFWFLNWLARPLGSILQVFLPPTCSVLYCTYKVVQLITWWHAATVPNSLYLLMGLTHWYSWEFHLGHSWNLLHVHLPACRQLFNTQAILLPPWLSQFNMFPS